MTDIVVSYKDFIIPVFSVLLLGIGYLLKELFQKNKNKKVALFILLEIWSREISTKPNIEEFYLNVFNLLANKYGINLSKEVIDPLIQNFSKISQSSLNHVHENEIDKYTKQLDEAIKLIASEDPVFAYRINYSNFVQNQDNYMQRYSELIQNQKVFKVDDVLPDYMNNISNEVKDKAHDSVLETFEENIKSLSLKISIFTYIEVLLLIRKVKKNLKNIEIEEDELELIIKHINDYLSKLNKDEKILQDVMPNTNINNSQ